MAKLEGVITKNDGQKIVVRVQRTDGAVSLTLHPGRHMTAKHIRENYPIGGIVEVETENDENYGTSVDELIQWAQPKEVNS
jgi:ribosomal protein S1